MVRRGLSCRDTLQLLLSVILSLLAPVCRAQRLNSGDDVATPEPASAHDYIGLINETVNPANGSLQLQFHLPVPKGRGITLPASLIYTSNASYIAPFLGGTNWQSIAGPTDAQQLTLDGNWGFAVPLVTATQGQAAQYSNTTTYYCNYATYYVFNDATGVQHSLNLDYADATVPSEPYACQYTESLGMQNGSSILSGGDAHFIGTLTSDTVTSALLISDYDGTVYHFPAPTFSQGSTPDYIEDRNGNRITPSFPGQHGVFSFTDDVGRIAASSSGIGPAGTTTTFSGTEFTYNIGWSSGATGGADYSVNPLLVTNPNNEYTCYPPPATYGAWGSQVGSVTLPDNEQYTFTYDAATGELKQINYPDGGSITYTWEVSQTQNYEQASYDGQGRNAASQLIYTTPGGCVYRYSLPQIETRTVNYGNGSGITQTYTYTPTWGSSDWTQKTTTVITTDIQSQQSFKTVYTYTPQQVSTNTDLFTRISSTQVPVESMIQYYDWGSTKLLRTVHKAWSADLLTCEVDTLEDGVTSSGKWYSYQGDIVVDLKEYDWGAISANGCSNTSAPSGYTRETKMPLNIVSTPVGGSIWEPTSKMVLNGAGAIMAETDYSYDQAPIGAIAPVPNLPTGTHDESNFSASYTGNRGNVTTKTEKCFLGSTPCASNPVTTYAYDETGKVVKLNDPCGNATCGDMSASNHITSYFYTDTAGNGNTSTNAYLTTIKNPLGQAKLYQYNYTIGKLTQSTDENSESTTYGYSDPLQRLTDIYGPASAQNGGAQPHTNYQYTDGAGANIRKTDPAGVVSLTYFDGMGDTTQKVLSSDPGGSDMVDTTYDGQAHVQSVSNPYRASGDPVSATYPSDGITSFSYDGLGRKIDQCQPDNSTTKATTCTIQSSYQSWIYSLNTVTFADENGNQWQRTTDGLGRLTKVVEPSSVGAAPSLPTGYTYDTQDNLLTVTQHGGASDTARIRSFNYDSLSQLLCASNPESSTASCPTTATGAYTPGTVGYTYDANGNLSSRTDARGIVTSYTYDALNRILSKSYALVSGSSVATPASCFQYDTATRGVGLLASEWTLDGPCKFPQPASGFFTLRSLSAYDEMGRITSEQQCTPASCVASSGPALSFYYDLAGKPTQLSNSVGAGTSALTISNTFDGGAHLSVVSSSWTAFPTCLYVLGGSDTNCTPVTAPYGYGPVGPLTWTHGANLTVTKGYTNRLWVNSISAAGQLGEPYVPGGPVKGPPSQ